MWYLTEHDTIINMDTVRSVFIAGHSVMASFRQGDNSTVLFEGNNIEEADEQLFVIAELLLGRDRFNKARYG